MLVRTDNMAVVAYINHQGGLRSPNRHCVAHKLLLWALKAVHLPGVMNWAADLLSSGRPHSSECRIHLEVMNLIWERFCHLKVDLFVTQESTHCPLWFSLLESRHPLGIDAPARELPKVQLYAFPSLALSTAVPREDQTRTGLGIPESPKLAQENLVLYTGPAPGQQALGATCTSRPAQPGAGEPVHPDPASLHLWVWPLSNLSDEVITTMQNARAASTRSQYRFK